MLKTITENMTGNEKIIDQRECQNCGSNDLLTDKTRGEMICSRCGLVIEDRMIDQGSEWRAYNQTEFEKRARNEVLSYSLTNDLSTYISGENKDASGQNISYEKQSQFFRLRKWQMRYKSQNSKDRNLKSANIELDRLCSQLQVPGNVKETAGQIYKKSFTTGALKGFPINSMIAASVYAAARVRRIPRPLEEVSDATLISKKRLGQCYRLLVNRMNYKIPPTKPTDLIVRMGTEIGVSSLTQQLAVRIIIEATNNKLTIGKSPSGMAASALYLAGMMNGEKRTQQLIAKVSHVTEVTIRHRYKDLIKLMSVDSTKQTDKKSDIYKPNSEVMC